MLPTSAPPIIGLKNHVRPPQEALPPAPTSSSQRPNAGPNFPLSFKPMPIQSSSTTFPSSVVVTTSTTPSIRPQHSFSNVDFAKTTTAIASLTLQQAKPWQTSKEVPPEIASISEQIQENLTEIRANNEALTKLTNERLDLDREILAVEDEIRHNIIKFKANNEKGTTLVATLHVQNETRDRLTESWKANQEVFTTLILESHAVANSSNLYIHSDKGFKDLRLGFLLTREWEPDASQALPVLPELSEHEKKGWSHYVQYIRNRLAELDKKAIPIIAKRESLKREIDAHNTKVQKTNEEEKQISILQDQLEEAYEILKQKKSDLEAKKRQNIFLTKNENSRADILKEEKDLLQQLYETI